MKRKFELMFIVMATLMLFATTEVMAECPQTSYNAGGGIIVSFNGVTMTDCKNYVNGTEETIPCYDYSYSISGLTTGLAQAVALIPVCCQDPIVTYPACQTDPTKPPYPCSIDVKNGDFGDSPSKIYLPGAGDPTTKLGVGIGMVYAIRSEPTGTLPNPHIYSSSPMTGPISMQLKTSKGGLYYVQNIVGPRCSDCGVPIQVPSVTEKRIIVEGVPVKLEINSMKCVQKLWLCRPGIPTHPDPYWDDCNIQDPVTITATSYDPLTGNVDQRLTDTTIREISDIDGNQRCAWGRMWMADSPGCTSMPAGSGKYYLVGDTCQCTPGSATKQCYPGKTCQSTATGYYCK